MKHLLIPLAFVWAGCSAEVSIETDPDGDGISDADEAAIGADPLNPDSDEDGYRDDVELAQNTDLLDPDDHPYAGGWSIDTACRDDIVSTGNANGEVANNFSLLDQHGEQVSLHSFCNQVVYMVFAAFW